MTSRIQQCSTYFRSSFKYTTGSLIAIVLIFSLGSNQVYGGLMCVVVGPRDGGESSRITLATGCCNIEVKCHDGEDDCEFIFPPPDTGDGEPGGGGTGCGGRCGNPSLHPSGRQLFSASQLTRTWIPTQSSFQSSFSSGYFSELDSQLQIYPEQNGISINYFTPTEQYRTEKRHSYLLVDGLDGDTQDGIFHDLRNVRIKEMKMLNSSGTVVTSIASASKFELLRHTGEKEQVIDFIGGPNAEGTGCDSFLRNRISMNSLVMRRL